MTFIIDAQLPPALARTLRAVGCEAFAVRELGLRDAADTQLWNYALQHGAAIVTKDEDFAQRCLYSIRNHARLFADLRPLVAAKRWLRL